ncbi:MAG: hypothetical protein V4721_00425 [Bacteroidota bacterium]
MTEKDLWQSDLDSLKRAVGRHLDKGVNKGEIGYGEYGENPEFETSAWDGGITGQGVNPLQAIFESINDPKFRMETTLGMARYDVDPNGDAIVSDKYDFNATRPQVDAYHKESGGKIASLLRAYKEAGFEGALNVAGNSFIGAEGEGTPVRINLGPAKRLSELVKAQ